MRTQLPGFLLEVRFAGRTLALFRAEDRSIVLPMFLDILSRQSRNRARVARVIAVANALGLSWLIVKSQRRPFTKEFGIRFAEWEQQIRSSINDLPIPMIIMIPPQGIERGRLYALFINQQDRRKRFFKIGLDEENNTRLEKEAITLQQLGRSKMQNIRVPKLMDTRRFKGWCSLGFEPLPESTLPFQMDDPGYEKTIDQFRGKPRKMLLEDVLSSDWGRVYVETVVAKVPNFARELETQRHKFVWVCRAHGDPGPHNFLRAGSTSWIIDWEDSDSLAPILTDPLSLELGRDRDAVIKNTKNYLRGLLLRHNAVNLGKQRLNVMLALAFRAAAGHEDALALMNSWKASNGR